MINKCSVNEWLTEGIINKGVMGAHLKSTDFRIDCMRKGFQEKVTFKLVSLRLVTIRVNRGIRECEQEEMVFLCRQHGLRL